MAQTIYALLVGIDEYPAPVTRLRGCVNDVNALEAYLRARVANGDHQLRLVTLTNAAATRQAVIDAFRRHLSQAGAADVALFYYSGHGSQQPAPQEFWDLEPDRLNETLVCWDSRTAGGWDLADKELAQLIGEVAERGPLVTLILDCCHSGSATRREETVLGVRGIPIDERQRPFNTFITSTSNASAPAMTRSANSSARTWATLPTGRHVVLAACQDRQLAYEHYSSDGQMRGAFSYFLIDTLQRARSTITCRDLFKRTNALVRSAFERQAPQMEATNVVDLDRPFLEIANDTSPAYFTVSHHSDQAWVMDGGALHGIPPATADATTTLALFPFDHPLDQMRDLTSVEGHASVIEVLPHFSRIQIDSIANLDIRTTYKAIVTDLPLARLPVRLTGDHEGIDPVRQQLAKATYGSPHGLYIRETDDPAEASFLLHAASGAYRILRADGHAVVHMHGYTTANANRLAQWLERIARWTTIAHLANPTPVQLQPNDISIEVRRLGGGAHNVLQQELLWPSASAASAAEVRMSYTYENGSWVWPKFEIRLTNKRMDSEPLYCALLALTEDYCVSNLLPGGSVRLGRGEATAVRMGGKLSDELWAAGVTESTDILKLIICTEEFDATLLEQGHNESRGANRPLPASTPAGILQRQMSRDQTRTVVTLEHYNDWLASEMSVTVVRPSEAAPQG